ncbi:phenylalanine--tRNA ligase subunit alpha [Desulfuromonas acetoxidans]|uniref:Phenylalanine--tRNA ligase alpha subunit n=1 Tax=Desulfuromonas acetoxidans (strain DSM 684 / 11070) TaxID=281689 RepID=Q1JYJ9_DESA6|nr:phenylalanine--tRNA ligase subunit alpha [Desulfuromonas acetoxidans]EAT15416.1 phenylalanyl-tRNA synthetase, alpha subunit [Desulfuromonas acetoxidans DSM 684]MBF0646783.1 phenylalanine--tRNA ligase subunit alpha [Desulfuromonas acetoxidans]NVD24448.1 phenylalanine--tRNA ligase subunit alpha [Desulfuromonas acetoxidans]NVE16604.1 phenylalanine--tRNA ligase subunit alpha [Desulfuromonas acetoxidans]
MKEKLEAMLIAAKQALADAVDETALQDVRVRFLGKKGELTAIMKGMGGLSSEERPVVGAVANRVKDELSETFEQRLAVLKQHAIAQKLANEKIDVSLPGRRSLVGSKHPVTLVTEELIEIFSSLGFCVAEGPEVEQDFYNFEALNIPKDHPARDMQDTFYINDEVVLRTHTSPVQIRSMIKQKPPVRVIAPGTVYRRDSDITHSPMFHQIEGFMVDENITFGDLKGILTTFIQECFGKSVGVRFRPSFFPFTEPSAEVDIQCVICGGKGCRVCKNSGWLEILGSGMIDPEVFKSVNYDSERYSGFAFGMGLERIAMLKYGVNDLRLFFENDVRFLRQF